MNSKSVIVISCMILSSIALLPIFGCTKSTAQSVTEPLQNVESLEKMMEAVESAEHDPMEPEHMAPPPEMTDEDVGYRRINVNAYRFGYEPDRIEVGLGENIMLTVTSTDVGHGFALPAFGINSKIPAEESVSFTFVADKTGTFEFFNPIQSGEGWKDMEGTFIVTDTSLEDEVRT